MHTSAVAHDCLLALLWSPEPDESIDMSAEIMYCSILALRLGFFLSTTKALGHLVQVGCQSIQFPFLAGIK